MNSIFPARLGGLWRGILAFSLASGLAACGTPENEADQGKLGATNNALWCNARSILSERCVACHDGRGTGGSPMGLSTYSDIMADSKVRPGSRYGSA